MNQVAVPGAADINGSGQGSCLGMVQAVDAFVGEVYRDAQACFFDEPALRFVDRFGMVAERVDQVGCAAAGASHTVQLFVDIGDTVFPDLILPSFGGQGVFQDTPEAVEGGHLATFFFQCHLVQKVLYTRFDRGFGIFINVFYAVLVKVYPPFFVDRVFRLYSHTTQTGGSK